MYRVVKRASLFAVTAVTAALAVAGCKATESSQSGFNSNANLMTRDASVPFQRTYWNKKYDQHDYTEILIAPANTDYVAAQNFWEKANLANSMPGQDKTDIAAIAEYTRQSFTRAFADDPKHRFKVVSTAGPKTLILEVAITQLVPSKAVLNAIGYITWIPAVVSLSGSTATDSQDTGKGVIAIEGRIRDGGSGEIIGMFADREHPPTAIVDLKALNWWAPAKAIIDQWSKDLVAVANRPPGVVVKEAPAFELLVW
jgi:hypothetical protein